MKYPIRSLALTAAFLFAGGCDFVDYYPKHEAPQQNTDLRKDGPGNFGGTNSNYPVGTPAAADANAPAINPTAGSYSGANVGGAMSADQANKPTDGTTQTGTAGGH